MRTPTRWHTGDRSLGWDLPAGNGDGDRDSPRPTMTDDNPDATTTDAQPTSNPYRIGDPVVDLAQGRPMIVLDAPEQNVVEWSGDNDYNLLRNYANGKFDPDPDEYVVECVYVSDVRSEPSKSYTFPVSRVCLIDAHHADGGARIYDRIARDVMEQLFGEIVEPKERHEADWIEQRLTESFSEDLVSEARELAEIEQTVTAPEES